MNKLSQHLLNLPLAYALWALFVLSFTLNTQSFSRISIGFLSVPPSYFILALFMILSLLFPRIFTSKGIGYITLCATFYIFILFLSSYWNSVENYANLNLKTTIKWIAFFATIVFVSGSIRNIEAVHRLIQINVVVITLISLYGIYYYKFISADFVNPFWKIGANQNSLSNWNISTFLLCMYVIYQAKGLLYKAIWSIMLFILIYAQAFTFSRTGWAMIVLSFIMFSFSIGRMKVFLINIIVIAIAVILILHSDRASHFTNRFKTLTTSSNLKTSSQNRLDYARKTLQIIESKPFLGIGADNFTEFTPKKIAHAEDVSHNIYLKIFSDTGLIGAFTLILFALMIMTLSLKCYWILYNTKESYQLLNIFLCVLILMLWRGLTSHEFVFMPVTSFVIGLTIAYLNCLIHEYQNSSSQREPSYSA